MFLSTPFVTSSVAIAESDPIYTKWLSNEAVGGYDVVSFYAGKPLDGKDRFMIIHQGAEWRFSTRANLDLFKINPDAFIPQYGGYCAWAIARGKLAKGSPENWHVRDGKLYLIFNDRIQDQWQRDIPGFIGRADRNWPQILED
ncbi:MAG: hypothetical protein HKN36_07910 [Hellea sp.]|nr:hypothetical protein [Hellea sp.]